MITATPSRLTEVACCWLFPSSQSGPYVKWALTAIVLSISGIDREATSARVAAAENTREGLLPEKGGNAAHRADRRGRREATVSIGDGTDRSLRLDSSLCSHADSGNTGPGSWR